MNHCLTTITERNPQLNNTTTMIVLKFLILECLLIRQIRRQMSDYDLLVKSCIQYIKLSILFQSVRVVNTPQPFIVISLSSLISGLPLTCKLSKNIFLLKNER